MLVQRYTSGRLPRTGTVIGVHRRDYHSRLTGATRMPRHSWWALYAPEDPPIHAAVSSRSWGRFRCPRFRGDGQSDSEAVGLSLLSRRKRRLRESNFFFLGGPAASQPAPLSTTIIPSSAFLTSESKRLLHRRGGGLPWPPIRWKRAARSFSRRVLLTFSMICSRLHLLSFSMCWTFHYLSWGRGQRPVIKILCLWTKHWRPGRRRDVERD